MKFKNRLDALLKPADRKRKPQKMYQPPGTGFRKAGVFLIWGWIALVTLVILSTLANTTDTKAEVETILSAQQENIATSTVGTEFAKKFAATYFTWEPTSDGWDTRKTALAPMMAAGIDEQAGIVVSKQEWSSKLKNARVAKVVPTGPQRGLVTLEVTQELSKVVDNENQKETVETFFTVPVGYEQGFGIYQLPSFTAVHPANELEVTTPAGEFVEGDVQKNVENFLPTFFQSYATDTPDKLAYFLEDPENTQGLEGSMVFEEVAEANVRGTKEDKVYDVTATVILRDPVTGSGYQSEYQLVVEEQDGRYVVRNLNEGVE